MLKESQYENNGEIEAKEGQNGLEFQMVVSEQQLEQEHQESQKNKKQLNDEQQVGQKQQKLTLDALSMLLQILHNPNKYRQHPSQSNPSNTTIPTIISHQPIQSTKEETKLVNASNGGQGNGDEQNEKITLKNLKPLNKSQFAQYPQQKQQSLLETPQYLITSSHRSFSTLAVKNPYNASTTQLKKQHNNNISSKFMPSYTQVQSLMSLQPDKQPIDNTEKTTWNSNNSLLSKKKSSSIRIKQQQSQTNNNAQSGISLYQQVLAKNFQVINGLLKKLNQIYSHHQSYDKNISQLNQKMHKLEVDNENIHHQFRTSHFMIDKKLNSITNQYSNMLQDLNSLKKTWNDSSQGMDKIQFFSKVFSNNSQENFNYGGRKKNTLRRVSPRKSSRKEKMNKQNSKLLIEKQRNYSYKYNQQSTTDQSLFTNESPRKTSHHNSTSLHRSTHKRSLRLSRKSKNLMNLKGLNEKNLGRALLQQISESNSGSELSKQSRDEYFTDGEQESMNNVQYEQNYNNNNSIKEQKLMKRQRHSKTLIEPLALNNHQQLNEYISNQITKIFNQNQQLSNFTQLGIQSMMQKKCLLLEGRIEQKFVSFRKQVLQEKIYNQFKESLIQEMQKVIDKDLSIVRQQLGEKISLIQNKLRQQMNTKCDRQQIRQELKEILQSMSVKVNSLMNDCYHKFAERNQTKRAILFLEKKINKLVEVAQRFSLDPKIDEHEKVKCLSCNKGFVSNQNNSSLSSSKIQYDSQPMLSQVHLLQKSTSNKQLQQQEYMMTKRKQNNQSQMKNAVRFRELSKYNTVSEVFQSNKKQQLHQNRESFQIGGNNQYNSQTKIKQISQTSQNLYPNSSSKSKHLSHVRENRPTTSSSIGFLNNQKSWKEKASNLLKKDHSGINWRSKSQYKK